MSENILLIEDRINSLNKLVKDADKAIMLLSRELEKRKEASYKRG